MGLLLEELAGLEVVRQEAQVLIDIAVLAGHPRDDVLLLGRILGAKPVHANGAHGEQLHGAAVLVGLADGDDLGGIRGAVGWAENERSRKLVHLWQTVGQMSSAG